MSTTTTLQGSRRGRLSALVGAVAVIALAAPALAVTATIGNNPDDRQLSDSYVNFTIVDTNHPAPFDGYFTHIDYFAEVPGKMRFVVVDSSNTVTWISDEIDVAAAGASTEPFDAPVGVTAGSNLGVYSVGSGVISYDLDPAATVPLYEDSGSGLPLLGDPLAQVDPNTARLRFYSMSADITASSPAICKNGGWEPYGYINQGQCIASVVANPNSGH